MKKTVKLVYMHVLYKMAALIDILQTPAYFKNRIDSDSGYTLYISNVR